MGKNKEPDPEPEKIIRTLGENLSIAVSENEKKYRNKNGPDDVKDINKEKVKCTVCAKSVTDVVSRGTEPYVHMVLGVLMCKNCACFYGDGYFSVDEDGDDKYCRWCGQGGTLYLCSSCTCAFCKKCIKQNLSKQDVKDLESDDWKCLICNPKPLFECRTVCWAIQEYSKSKKGETEEGVKESSSSKSKRDKGKKSSLSNEIVPSSVSRKRKASEIEDEPEKQEDKRRRSSESTRETKQQKSLETSTSSRRSRNHLTKKEKSEDEQGQNQLKNDSKPKRSRDSEQEDEVTPVKKSSRTSKKLESNENIKIEEVVISDGEENNKSKQSPKKSSSSKPSRPSKKASTPSTKSRKSKGDTPNLEDEGKKDRPSRSAADKTPKDSKSTETPPTRSSQTVNKKSSGKNKKPKKSEIDLDVETPSKHSHCTSKRRNSRKDESEDESSKKSDSEEPLIPLDDGNSSSESENKSKSSRSKSGAMKFIKTMTQKIKLPIAKNAEKKVVEASGYINSALKDVLELSVLISSRCEKLCNKSVQSSEDVLNVLSKLKQLMCGVHTNLELIERGLDTKINLWKGEAVEIKKQGEEKEVGDKLIQSEETPKSPTFNGKDSNKNENILGGEESSEIKAPDQIEDENIEGMSIDIPEEKKVTDIQAVFNESMEVCTKSEINENENIAGNLKEDNESRETVKDAAKSLGSESKPVDEASEKEESHDEEEVNKFTEKSEAVDERHSHNEEELNKYEEKLVADNKRKSQDEEELNKSVEKSVSDNKEESHEEEELNKSEEKSEAGKESALEKSDNAIDAELENNDSAGHTEPETKDTALDSEHNEESSVNHENKEKTEKSVTDDSSHSPEKKSDVYNSKSDEAGLNQFKNNDSTKFEKTKDCENGSHENIVVAKISGDEKETESIGLNDMVSDCKSESDMVKRDGVESSLRNLNTIEGSDPNGSGVTDSITVREDVLDKVFSEDEGHSMEKETLLAENDTKNVSENLEKSTFEVTEAISLGEDNNCISPPTQTKKPGDLKNGPNEDNKASVEDKKVVEGSIEPTKSIEQNEDRVSRRSFEDNKSSSRQQHAQSPDRNRRLSGDRGRYSHESPRWSGERAGNWDRERERHRDRRPGGRGGHWNQYENRRPSRGGWGW